MTSNPANSDRVALAAALTRYEGPLLRYAVRLTGDAELAREIVQDTFVRLCERRAPQEAEPNCIQFGAEAIRRESSRDGQGPWLFAVCRNRALDLLKRRRTRRSAGNEAEVVAGPAQSPDAALERHDEHARVLGLLATLPERQQQVVRLKFQAGLSYKEIAEVMGLSATNVGFLIHVAIKSLRERLGV